MLASMSESVGGGWWRCYFFMDGYEIRVFDDDR